MSQNGSASLLIIIIIVSIFKWLKAVSKFNSKMSASNIISMYMLCGHAFHKLNGRILVGYDYNDPSK